MIILKRFFCLFAFVFAFGSLALADSPLTSTDFSKAYSNEKIVVAASQTNGVLTEELMKYLVDAKKPIDVKMAIINQLGWNIDGKNNSQIFLDYILKKYKYSDIVEASEKAKADVILSFAYLKAMDNYFQVEDAGKLAQIAVSRNPKSRTFNLIAGLIRAQSVMEQSFCEVYQITDGVRKNADLKNDLKPEAVSIIYEYTDGYREYCKH